MILHEKERIYFSSFIRICSNQKEVTVCSRVTNISLQHVHVYSNRLRCHLILFFQIVLTAFISFRINEALVLPFSGMSLLHFLLNSAHMESRFYFQRCRLFAMSTKSRAVAEFLLRLRHATVCCVIENQVFSFHLERAFKISPIISR